MEPIPRPDSDALFTTLDQIRVEHARLLDADSDDTPPGPEFWLEVRAFAVRVAESGIYFGEPHEVKTCQGYLSYWGHELSRAKAEKQWSGDVQVPELRPYDETALQALQSRYANPFEGLAKEAQALLQDAQRGRFGDELAALIEGRAAAAGLRFELDLVKEIASQVAGDAYAPTLIEFCLYHLFEDPQTRIGNKLRRPPGERSFGCLQYLVDKAESLYCQQGPAEQQAILDALSLDPLEPSDAVFSELKIDAVTGAMSPTFRDAAGHSLVLRPFLVSSRLLVEAESGLYVVHPALFRRWPILFAEIRVRRERELAEIRERGERDRNRRRRWMYGFAAVAVASIVFGISQFVARKGEENERAAHSLAAGSYTEAGEKRLEMAFNAVNTSLSPTTMTALNEAIWAMLAADARTASQDRKPPREPLAARGTKPSVAPCEGATADGGSLCFVNSKRERVMLPELTHEETAFGTNPNEEWVAVAWPKYGGTGKAGRIQLAVFHVMPGESAALVGGIRDTDCEGTVAKVRVSPKGSAVTIDCVPASEGRLWDLDEVPGNMFTELVVPRDSVEAEQDAIQALYFASPGESGFAALKDGGVLEVMTDANPKPQTFRSDILRVMGRPGHLTFLKDRGFAALGAFNAPLVMVHEETGKGLGRDTIYAVPGGLGAAWEVRYSPTGECIEVSTWHDAKAFAYHIILDADILKAVAQQLAGPAPRYEASWRCGFVGVGK